MKITFEQLETYVKPSLKKQFLRIQLEPGLSGAVVTLKREGEEASSETSYTDATGSKAWNKEFGTYVYEIKAPNYNVSKGEGEAHHFGQYLCGKSEVDSKLRLP